MGVIVNNSYLDYLAYLGVGGAHPGGLHLTKNLLGKEKLDETTSVLEIGCGTGQTSVFIVKQYGCPITALDNNEIMVMKAKQRCSDVQLPIVIMQGEAEKLPFEDNSFDLVLSESVLSFTNISSAILEAKRVLKPNGVLLAIEVTQEKNLSEEDIQELIAFYGFSQVLSEDEWNTMFQAAGFHTIQMEKHEIVMDDQDLELELATDFTITEGISMEYMDALSKHAEYTSHYREQLGFRVIRCIK